MKKDLILKTFMVIGIILLICLALGPIASLVFLDNILTVQASEKLALSLVVSSIVINTITIILLNIWGLKTRNSSTEKYSVNIDSFEMLKNKFCEFFSENKYNKINEFTLSTNGELTIYVQKNLIKLNAFLLININILTPEITQQINEIYKDTIEKLYGSKRFIYKINLISFVCVNKVSSTFYKTLNDATSSSITEFNYNAGYSFGGKTLYLENPNNGLSQSQRKIIRNQILDIVTGFDTDVNLSILEDK